MGLRSSDPRPAPGPGRHERRVLADADSLAREAALWLAAEIRASVAERGRCRLALAGGRTPEPIYRRLAACDGIDWSAVDIFFGDERAVPPDHPDSNFRMAREALCAGGRVPPGRLRRMEADRPDREAAARDYDRLLPDRLDVLLLGTGPDGHTASLFPGSAALSERERRVVPVIGPKPPAARLTITPPVIAAARRVAVVAAGADKSGAVAVALEGPAFPAGVPVGLARGGTWFLDGAAAAGLAPGKADS